MYVPIMYTRTDAVIYKPLLVEELVVPQVVGAAELVRQLR